MFNKAAEIVVGLCYLHESGATHRNLKLSNIISLKQRVGNEFKKIKDYGLTRGTLSSMLTFGSNDFSFYDAPEIIQDEPFTPMSDVWALGCMMYELMNGKPF